MTCAHEELWPLVALEDGSLDGSVLAELSQCETCARELPKVRAALAEIAASLAPIEPSIVARATLLDSASGAAPYAGFARRVARLFALDAETTASHLRALSDPSCWEPHAPGVELLHVAGGAEIADADAGFVRFAPDLPYPLHEHHGDEVMFLLAGSLRDDVTGKVSLPGDTLVHGPGTRHSFRVGNHEACVVALLLFGGEPTILADR